MQSTTPDSSLDAFQKLFIPGRIFYLFCNFTTPPKFKFLLLVCDTGKPLFFVINSEINDFILKRAHLYRCQVMIRREDHKCFSEEFCYINCAEAIDRITVQEVIDQCVNGDMTRIKEMITDEERNNVINAVNDSETISAIDKKRILDCLTKSPH